MTIQTRDFGKMELDEAQLLEFVSPIFGFESLTRFALLSDDDTGGELMWLQSVEDSEVCFILLDPEEVGLDYAPQMNADVVELLGGQMPALRLIAVVPEDFRQTTVNLKSPIVINPTSRKAAQVLLEADYPIRLALFDSEEGKKC